jgi:hypothetical protein
MMMRYHFGHGVGHTYLRYEPSDSIDASNTGESVDDDDANFQSAQPELAGSEIFDEFEDELGEDDDELGGFGDDLY